MISSQALTNTLMTFFKACREVLKEDIMNVFHDFHARGKFERSLNAAFIALMLKPQGVGPSGEGLGLKVCSL